MCFDHSYTVPCVAAMQLAMASSSTYESDDDDEAPTLVALEDPSNEAAARTSNNNETNEQRFDIALPLPPCPVTILSGFLGAGKTTLVQYILQSPDHGKRIAVIENEFGNSGALSIESMIARDGLTSDSLQEFIELPNGCICCTVKDSLVLTLENLLDKRADLDYILIECSGMANPGPIAAIFWLDDTLQSRLKLDGIVTVVDAVNVEHQLRETEEASQQIAYADRILLNKVDLLPKSDDASLEMNRVLGMIRSIHPTADIQTTTYSAVPDLEWILDAGCFDADRAQYVTTELQSHPAVDAALSHDHSHEHGDEASCAVCTTTTTTHHTHTAAVSTVSLHIDGTVDIDKVNQWLASILWPNQDQLDRVLRARLEQDTAAAGSHHDANKATDQQQIFRLKGILSVRHAVNSDELLDANGEQQQQYVDAETAIDRRRYIVQGVHDLWDIHATTSTDLQWNDEEEERSCQLIIIGRHLKAAELQDSFDACRI
jgi:G3E family GTPase